MLSSFLWIRDFQLLSGLLFSTYKDPADYGIEREYYPKGKEGTELYNADVKEFNEEYNSFYNKTHYRRSSNMEWEKGEDGRDILDLEGNKIPKYKTAFDRALHFQYMEDDAKFWKNLVSILPFLKSVRVFNNPKQALDNYFFGQQLHR